MIQTANTILMEKWVGPLGWTSAEAWKVLRDTGIAEKRFPSRTCVPAGTRWLPSNLPSRGYWHYFDVIDEYIPHLGKWVKVSMITPGAQTELRGLLESHEPEQVRNRRLWRDRLSDWRERRVGSGEQPQVESPFDYLIQSEAERRFWEAYKRSQPRELAGLRPQHPVGPYSLDFAIPHRRWGVEIDGWAYHSGRQRFVNDRVRHRHLQRWSWQLVRFAGKEACDKPDWCVAETAGLFRIWAGE
jgi:very-short-patch-repair endonuclease